MSLPSTTVVSRKTQNSRQINPAAGNSKSSESTSGGNGNSKKANNNKSKPMSKRQKLLRKRFEEQKNLAAKNAAEKSRQIGNGNDCDELDQEDVKVKYSIVYFNWAVSDSEDSDSEENPDDKTGNGNGKSKIHRNITLPLRKMRLKD